MGLNVIILDNDRSDAEITRNALEHVTAAGSTRWARDTAEALEFAEWAHVVLVDLDLGIERGEVAAVELREMGLEVIYLSGANIARLLELDGPAVTKKGTPHELTGWLTPLLEVADARHAMRGAIGGSR